MNEEKIKYIRGVEGRCSETRALLISMGAATPISLNCDDPKRLYFVDTLNKICNVEAESRIGQLLIEHGEEMFLEPQYKFNVGDKVAAKNALPSENYHTVVSQVNDKGEPWYELERNGLKSLFIEEDLEPYAERKVKTWNDLEGKTLNGYFIDSMSSIIPYSCDAPGQSERNTAASEKVCKAMLAMAQISQLLPYYGGEITDEEWSDNSVCKYILIRLENEIETCVYIYAYEFLAFHTPEQRDEFLANNEQLVRDFLMID